MSSFQLPKNTSAQIDARRCDFFLRFSDSNCHLYPKAWDSICKPKSSSGLNFRRAHDLNKALVSKLGWTIALSADKPWANLLRSKYLRGRSLLNASAKTNSSPLWHGSASAFSGGGAAAASAAAAGGSSLGFSPSAAGGAGAGSGGGAAATAGGSSCFFSGSGGGGGGTTSFSS
ncbi:putative ribonuclease h protein [Quercus suber]|uniref:Ribonuclease h protein n=1 Tax=Quercus suber TaxID=58331 RepID=A0AAW0KXM4_QUESU